MARATHTRRGKDDRNGANNKIDTDIYFSKRTASTGTWGTNLRVNDDITGNPVQRNPRIGGTSADDAFA
jgi:hypothetical protein